MRASSQYYRAGQKTTEIKRDRKGVTGLGNEVLEKNRMGKEEIRLGRRERVEEGQCLTLEVYERIKKLECRRRGAGLRRRALS